MDSSGKRRYTQTDHRQSYVAEVRRQSFMASEQRRKSILVAPTDKLRSGRTAPQAHLAYRRGSVHPGKSNMPMSALATGIAAPRGPPPVLIIEDSSNEEETDGEDGKMSYFVAFQSS